MFSNQSFCHVLCPDFKKYFFCVVCDLNCLSTKPNNTNYKLNNINTCCVRIDILFFLPSLCGGIVTYIFFLFLVSACVMTDFAPLNEAQECLSLKKLRNCIFVFSSTYLLHVLYRGLNISGGKLLAQILYPY